MTDTTGAEQLVTPSHWRRAVSVVSAVIRRGDDVLLVRNSGSNGVSDRWSLPGGSVHVGELLTEALAREVREETGLVVEQVGPMVVYSEHFIPAFADAMVISAFEVTAWRGDLRFEDDPDGEVCECVFVPSAEAAMLIEQSSDFAPVAAPVVAYLRGAGKRTWFWRVRDDGAGSNEPVVVVGEAG